METKRTGFCLLFWGGVVFLKNTLSLDDWTPVELMFKFNLGAEGCILHFNDS